LNGARVTGSRESFRDLTASTAQLEIFVGA